MVTPSSLLRLPPPGKRLGARLADERGQSWVETVVMLPVLLALLLGLFYLKDMVDMSMRAGEAARYVAWEGLWYVREDRPDRAILGDAALRARLRNIGLGQGLTGVKVTKRSMSRYTGAVSGAEPTFFIPQSIGDLFGEVSGSDSDDNFLSEIADGASSFANALFDIGGAVAVPVHEFFAYQTAWKGETDEAVYTAHVRYRFGYKGMFESLPDITIDEYASLLTHPLNIKRVKKSDNGDRAEYAALVGDPSEICDDSGHVFDLWLFPSGGFPPDTPLGSGFATGFTAVTDVLRWLKYLPCGSGGLLEALDSVLGGRAGFKMPDGTLKEFPELNLAADEGSTSDSGSGTGSGLGGCEGGGPTGATSGECP